MKRPSKFRLVEWITRRNKGLQGKWVVTFGSSLLMLGSGVVLAWSCIAFYLFSTAEDPTGENALSGFRMSMWPVLLYALGMMAALPVGSLLDNKIGPRIPCILGSCVSFVACIVGSFVAENKWLISTTFGLMNGAGFGLLLFPSSTVQLRWRAHSCNIVSLLKGTFFMAGFLLFAPMVIAIMASTATSGTHSSSTTPLKIQRPRPLLR